MRDWTCTIVNPKLPRWKNRKSSRSSTRTNTRNGETQRRALDFLGGAQHCNTCRPGCDCEPSVRTTRYEAMMDQIEASDKWNYYQTKSIKAAVLDAKTALADASNESDESKRARYEKEQALAHRMAFGL